MHTRQSGAAHVPILFFLILLVLFLGALGFGYVTLDKNNNLEAQHAKDVVSMKTLTGQNLLFRHYIEDLGNVIKQFGAYAGRANISAEDYANQTTDGVTGVMDPTQVKQKMEAFARQVEVSSAGSLEGLFGAVNGRVEALKKRVEDITGERDRVAQEKTAVDASFEQARNSHSAAQQNLRDQLGQTQQQHAAQRADLESHLNTTRQNLRDKNDELSGEREQRATEKKQLLTEQGKLRGHNTALVEKLAMKHPPDAPDGKVIAARNNVLSAWISLGRKDMLQTGTIFRLKNPNSDKVKAYAEVTRVEQERAEVRIYDVVAPVADQVREGDLLYNELYSPNTKRNVYMLGRFSYPYHKPELEKLLKSLGNKVHAKMEPGVDLVLLGNDSITEEGDGFVPITDTPEYKEALNLGVEFAPLHKVRDLIKL